MPSFHELMDFTAAVDGSWPSARAASSAAMARLRPAIGRWALWSRGGAMARAAMRRGGSQTVRHGGVHICGGAVVLG